jgi:hypothetical protein
LACFLGLVRQWRRLRQSQSSGCYLTPSLPDIAKAIQTAASVRVGLPRKRRGSRFLPGRGPKGCANHGLRRLSYRTGTDVEMLGRYRVRASCELPRIASYCRQKLSGRAARLDSTRRRSHKPRICCGMFVCARRGKKDRFAFDSRYTTSMEPGCKKVGDEPTMADGAMPYLEKFRARNALSHQKWLCS